jgi:hypothetical protein
MYLNRGNGQFEELPIGSGPGMFGIVNAGEVLNSTYGCVSSLVMDFNGDGIPDIFRYHSVGDEGLDCGTKPTYLYIGRGDGGFDRRTVTGVTLVKNKLRAACPVNNDPCDLPRADTFYVMDVDGDGRTDIVKTWLPVRRSNSTADACQGIVCTEIYRGNGAGGFSLLSPAPSVVTSKSLYQWPNEHGSVALSQQRFVIDVDGDGLADVVLGKRAAGTSGHTAWRSMGNGDFEPYATPIDVDDCKHSIDFNGDGRAECVWPDALSWQKNRLSVSTGTELHHVGGFNLTNVALKGDSTGTRVVDFNGDGRGDILRWSNRASDNRLFLSQGDGTFVESGSFNLKSSNDRLVSTGASYDFVTGDFIGNGSLSILRLVHSPKDNDAESNRLYVKSDATLPDLLLHVLSPSGLKTSLTYGSMVNLDGQPDKRLRRYVSDREEGQAASYPLVDLTVAGPVVFSMDVDSGVGAARNRTEYAYRGMKAAVDGRGMLGFRRTVQQSPAPNGEPLSIWTDYLFDEPYAGVARRTETLRGPWTEPGAPSISSTVNTYCDKTSPASPPDSDTTGAADTFTDSAPCATTARVRRPYLRRSVESGFDLDGSSLPTVTTVNTYNHRGDPLDIVVKTVGDVAGLPDQLFTKSTKNDFCEPGSTLPGGGACPNSTQGDRWILGRLISSTVTNTVPNLTAAITASPGTAPRATDISGGLSFALTPANDFGDVNLGAQAERTATLSNSNAVPIGVTVPTSASISHADYTVVATDCAAVLPASAQCSITLRFKPSSRGTVHASLTVTTVAGTKVTLLTGRGLQPVLSIEPPEKLIFARVQAGAVGSPVGMTLKNDGNASATALVFSAPAGFNVDRSGCPTSLSPGQSCGFTVAFAPPGTTTYGGLLTVSAADPAASASREVEGSSAAQAASIDPTLDFGPRLVQSAPELPVTLRNDGLGPLTLTVPTSASVTGTGFRFSRTDCVNPLSLPGGTCRVWVVFEPQSAGAATGALTVRTDAGDRTTALSGRGIRPVLEITPVEQYGFGSVQEGQVSAPVALRLTNKGEASAQG